MIKNELTMCNLTTERTPALIFNPFEAPELNHLSFNLAGTKPGQIIAVEDTTIRTRSLETGVAMPVVVVGIDEEPEILYLLNHEGDIK